MFGKLLYRTFQLLKDIVGSKKFFIFILLLTGVQGVFYASSIRFGVPPDESYHFRSIQYYASEPITSGPFITDQDVETIPRVRTIERNVSYLYHYLLSFPVRLMNWLGLEESIQILLLRLTSAALVVYSLYVLRSLLSEISDNKLLINSTVASLSITGMFIWLAGAISYDNLANLLIFAMILQLIRHIKSPGLIRFSWVISLGLAAVLVKYTSAPISAICIAVAAFYCTKRYGFKPHSYLRDLRGLFMSRRLASIVAAAALIMVSFLFVERVGVNLLSYGTVQPKCTHIHSLEECNTNSLLLGHHERRLQYQKEGGISSLDLSPFNHTFEWIKRYYSRLYGYFGHKRFGPGTLSQLGAILIFSMFMITLLFSRRKIKLNSTVWVLIGITAVYVLLLFLFNLSTYLRLGARTAYHGRYLVPVLSFIYFFAGWIIINTAKNMRSRQRKIFISAWVVTILFAVIMHFPPLLMHLHSNDDWYSDRFNLLNLPKR